LKVERLRSFSQGLRGPGPRQFERLHSAPHRAFACVLPRSRSNERVASHAGALDLRGWVNLLAAKRNSVLEHCGPTTPTPQCRSALRCASAERSNRRGPGPRRPWGERPQSFDFQIKLCFTRLRVAWRVRRWHSSSARAQSRRETPIDCLRCKLAGGHQTGTRPRGTAPWPRIRQSELD
jgi:hypothetical protein